MTPTTPAERLQAPSDHTVAAVSPNKMWSTDGDQLVILSTSSLNFCVSKDVLVQHSAVLAGMLDALPKPQDDRTPLVLPVTDAPQDLSYSLEVLSLHQGSL